jgi:hypothetical protein
LGVVERSPTTLEMGPIPTDQPIHIVYRAPSVEGAEVITASLFEGQVPCAPAPFGDAAADAADGAALVTAPTDLIHLLASAAVRVTVSGAHVASDAASDTLPPTYDAADAAAPDVSPMDAENEERTTDTPPGDAVTSGGDA